MITALEAEQLAQQQMQDYVKRCECNTNMDVALALGKLISMCSIGICAVADRQNAITILETAAKFLKESHIQGPWHSFPIN